MSAKFEKVFTIHGQEKGRRIPSRVLEERIQEAVAYGHRDLEIEALGHHGIGGRLWAAGDEPVKIQIYGPVGQRLGAMGFSNTHIQTTGNASDDVGWLNAGAEITVHGRASNGVANAMAQGKIYIAGDIGARGMTMTKHNPRFSPPELWVLGGAGDYFAEFMAGGIAVICGFKPQNPESILGYRPCVGMVGGKIFFRGKQEEFSEKDAKLTVISDEDWQWLLKNLNVFLTRIAREDLLTLLGKRDEWQLIQAKTPAEKRFKPLKSMHAFCMDIWEKELGQGGLIGDLTRQDRSPIPLITTGDLRRFVPIWENAKYIPPCQEACPSGIPVHERWRLIREGRVDEAVDLALDYTPFPATVCGYLCPNLCMHHCSRNQAQMPPVDITLLGKASLQANTPKLPEITGGRVAVVGGGPGGLSAAWQLRQMGHEVRVFDRNPELGGKIKEVIPGSRIPQEVLDSELQRVRELLPGSTLNRALQKEDFAGIKEDFDFVILAMGTYRPKTLFLKGQEHLVPALRFLQQSRQDQAEAGNKLAVIGAGNVGCDVACEAFRLGAGEVTLLDIQKPLAFERERKAAAAAGARFRWPVSIQEITPEGVVLESGELVAADKVILAIGEMPDLDCLPPEISVKNGLVEVDRNFQTSDAQIFAIGDLVRPGLITDAIGAGRKAAQAIDALVRSRTSAAGESMPFDPSRVELNYFDPRIKSFRDIQECAAECASCGLCRDCGVCIQVCPDKAISRQESAKDDFYLEVDPELCIGCGFCAQSCPCGVWTMTENTAQL